MNETVIAALKIVGKAAAAVLFTAATSVTQEIVNEDAKGIFSNIIKKDK